MEENYRRYEIGVLLDVPFAEKDEAKKLGAKWDAESKKWFVPKGDDRKAFEKWIPSQEVAE